MQRAGMRSLRRSDCAAAGCGSRSSSCGSVIGHVSGGPAPSDPHGHADARLHAERRPRRHLRGTRAPLRPRERRPSARSRADRPRPTRSSCSRPARPTSRILDIHDLAIARERGEDIVGIMAIVERPLAAVIAAPGVATPRQLDGQARSASPACPATPLCCDSVGRRRRRRPEQGQDDHDRLQRRRRTCSPARVAAATAFWNDEGVTLRERDRRVSRVPRRPLRRAVLSRAGPVRDRGEPARDPALARGWSSALRLGYGYTLADPQAGARASSPEVQGLDPKLVTRS